MSMLKESNPNQPFGRTDTEAEAPNFGNLVQKADSLEKTLGKMLGKIEGKRRRGWQRMRWLGSITDSMDINLSKFWGTEDRGAWWAAVRGFAKGRIQLSD